MTRIDEQHLISIAHVLRAKFGHVAVKSDYGWPGNSALSVLDCVLSLNRPYDKMVLPRLILFQRKYPHIDELAKLGSLLDEYAKNGDFFQKELNYNHMEREIVLRGVLRSLLAISYRYSGDTEWERLSAWANIVSPTDYASIGVKGFGLAGFQYLRMLFGAQTTKPDIWIKRFVSEVIGKSVNDLTAIALLEAAAKQERLPLREIDGAIWEAGARRIQVNGFSASIVEQNNAKKSEESLTKSDRAKRIVSITLNTTDEQDAEIQRRADEAEMTVQNYVIWRLLGSLEGAA